MKKTLTILIVLIFACNQVKSQTYSQTFENVTTNQLLDSGWVFSGVDIGNSNKLSGIKELVTQLLNVYTTGNTFVTTAYYNGKGTNTVQFQHVINNASGKDIDLVIDALDSANNVISSFTYTYNNASVANSNFSFAKAGRFKLKLSWSGAKVRSGSTAGLDMLLVNRPLAPIDLVSLPVTLNHFKAINKDCNNEISWSTASEENLSKFEVTRQLTVKTLRL